MALVELTTCWNAFEAEILKGALESAGIPCILQSSYFSNVEIGNGIANSACAIPILVREEDQEAAKQVIAEAEAAESEEKE